MKMARRGKLRKGQATLRPEVLLEFVRALVANTHSGDVIHLALLQTKSRTKATKRELAVLVGAIMQERGPGGGFPPGFMPEFDPLLLFEEEDD
jgi:hypothetical protein